MNAKDLDHVSRSWIGHIATNQSLLEQMDNILKSPGRSERDKYQDLANLINYQMPTERKEEKVHAGDISTILTYIASTFVGPQPPYVFGPHILNYYVGPGDPTSDALKE